MSHFFTKRPYFFQFVCFSLLLLNSLNSFAIDRFVKAGGAGTQSGLNWDNAMSSVATAVAAANAAAPALNNVYVAAGVYSLSAQISISNVNLNIQGGFPSNSTGTILTGYSPTANETVINGNGFGMFTVGSFYSQGFILKGLTLTEGVATSGSIFAAASSTATTCSYLFEDLKCINNWAVNGAFFFTTVSGPKIDFKNCLFDGCNSFDGGALHFTTTSNSTITIDGCAFNNCHAENGGAIYNTTGATAPGGIFKFNIKNSSFCSNFSALYGGAIYTTTAPIQIDNCTFTNNSTKSSYWGGAIFATTSSVNCTNSTFFGNHAKLGGAIYQTTSQSGITNRFDNCKFVYNYNMDYATNTGDADGGGAMHIEGTFAEFTINNSTFFRNSVPGGTYGGAIIATGAAKCLSMTGAVFFENRVGTSTTARHADIASRNGTARFAVNGATLQQASATSYVNADTSAGGFVFSGANTFANTTNTGGAASLVAGTCPVNVLSFSTSLTALNTGVGTIDCAKTQLVSAPVAGTASQLTLVVTINVTTAGTFTPITASGSGMTLANSVTSITTATTGVQTFNIPLKYDGTALGTLNFQVGTLTACTANLALAPKTVISNIWTLDNCSPIQVGPALK